MLIKTQDDVEYHHYGVVNKTGNEKSSHNVHESKVRSLVLAGTAGTKGTKGPSVNSGYMLVGLALKRLII